MASAPKSRSQPMTPPPGARAIAASPSSRQDEAGFAMLSANQLGIAITAVLVAAIAFGWILHWIWLRLAKEPQSDAARMDALIDRLHEADHAREEAENAREMAENMLATREADMKARLAAMRERMEGAIDGRSEERRVGKD